MEQGSASVEGAVTVGRKPFVEPAAVHNSNATRSDEIDQPTVRQISQRSTNRFNRHSEIISDVVPRSRQHEPIAIVVRAPLHDPEQECADLLPRGRTPQDEDELMGARHRAEHLLPDFMRDRWIWIGEGLQSFARVARDACIINNGFDTVKMALRSGKSKEVTREQQIKDLPTPAL